MLKDNNLNLVTWHKLTPAEQRFYIEGYLKSLDIDTDTVDQTPEQMFPQEEL
jgi:hypothetical protein